jgi:hypothetical protein
MRMLPNSSAKHPNYDVINYGQQAWADTRIFITGALHGNLRSVNHELLCAVNIWDLFRDSYGKSMELLLISLASTPVAG